MTNHTFQEHPATLVFDLDDTVAVVIDYAVEEQLRAAEQTFGPTQFAELSLTAMQRIHLVYPGFYALFQWLIAQGCRLCFFSNAVEERNLELVQGLMRRAFGDRAPEVLQNVGIFSRQHCIDTTMLPHDQENRRRYQSLFYGQRKKKLEGVIVTPEQLPNTLLIEDDTSYMVTGEEENLIALPCYAVYLDGHWNRRLWESLHKAYLLAGLLDDMFTMAHEQKIPLTRAAMRLRGWTEGQPLTRELFYATCWKQDYFAAGLPILQRYDPSLQFYGDPCGREE